MDLHFIVFVLQGGEIFLLTSGSAFAVASVGVHVRRPFLHGVAYKCSSLHASTLPRSAVSHARCKMSLPNYAVNWCQPYLEVLLAYLNT